MATGRTMLAGVIGDPVSHSRSPALHGAWLARHGIDGAYVPLPVEAAGFGTAVRGLVACGFRGANVTIPHKQAAFALCDTITPFARRAGAVNTLVFDGGRIHGSNTDGAGFLASLAAQDIDVRRGAALVLGAGGAARAIAAALQDGGVSVMLCSRRTDQAAALAAELGGGIGTLPWADRAAAWDRVALLVNTTSAGMHGQPPLDIALAAAPATLAVADIVYAPRETPLLAQARARGQATAEGIYMLLHQAVPGFQAWFGIRPVVDAALVQAVLAA